MSALHAGLWSSDILREGPWFSIPFQALKSKHTKLRIHVKGHFTEWSSAVFTHSFIVKIISLLLRYFSLCLIQICIMDEMHTML